MYNYSIMHKHLFTALLLSVLALNLCAQAADPIVQSGYDKINKRNFEGAIQDFNRLLISNPDNVDALCGRAEANNSLGSFADALKDADQALRIDVKSGLACSIKGDVYFNQKDYPNAQKFYEEASAKPNAPVQAIIGKAKVANQLGKPKDAFNLLDDAIDSKPNSAELYYARAILDNNREKYSKALDDFDKTASLNPNYNPFGVSFNRGLSYLNLQESENALKDFNKALEIDPTNISAINVRGMVQYNIGNYKDAIDDFLKMIDLNPNNAVVLYNIGMAYNKMEDKDNACTYFNKSCQLGNSNACKMYILVCYKGKR